MKGKNLTIFGSVICIVGFTVAFGAAVAEKELAQALFAGIGATIGFFGFGVAVVGRLME